MIIDLFCYFSLPLKDKSSLIIITELEMNKFVKGIAVAGLATAMSQGAIAACGDVTLSLIHI